MPSVDASPPIPVHFDERAVHVHPGTRPNKHSSDITAFTGAHYEKDGSAEVDGELMQLTATIAMGDMPLVRI